MRGLIVIGLGLAAAFAAPVSAQDIQLKAGTFLPPVDKFWYTPIQKFLDTVNDKGKPLGLSINMVAAGGKGVSPFEMGNAVKSGVLDVAHIAGTFYNKMLPLADAQKLSTISTAKERTDGTYDFLRPIYAQKMNVHYLGRWGEGVPFHLYLNKKVDKADLKGVKIRGTSVYQAFVEKLGGTMVITPPADAYTMVERGTVDGLGWPLWGIEGWGWHKVLKYRLEPGFYSSDISVLINLDTWKKLSKAQQAVLDQAMMDMENEFPKIRAANDEASRKVQADAGMQPMKLDDAEAAKFLKAAEDAGWDDIIKKDPENGPKIRALTTKK